MRLKIVRLINILLFLFVVGGLLYTQVIKGKFYYLQSRNNSIRVVSLDSRRGKIFDRNGLVIADNRASFDVAVIPQDIEDKDEVFAFLSQEFETTKERLFKVYRQKFLTPFVPVTVIRDISREKAIVVEENKFRFPGLMVRESFQRYHPFSEITAHVLGYVGKINRSKITELKEYGYNLQSLIGYSGIEEYYDGYLKGEDGGLQVEVNNRGKQVRVLSYKEPTRGQDLTLTIDSRIQQAALESLDGRRGAVVIMELGSGEMLGLVSSPSFNTNLLMEGRPEVSAIFSDSASPLLNRAIRGQYPPGSVFKIPVAVCALENKKITAHSTFVCNGFMTLGDRNFNCSHTHGPQGLTDAIAHSCNIYFYNLGLMLGNDLMSRYARLFGLSEKTLIDLPFEAKGYVPDRPKRGDGQIKRWFKGDILNLSIGQGDLLATPIQLTRLMSVVANRGLFVQPFLLKKLGPKDVLRKPNERKIDISNATWDAIISGLKGAVQSEEGTANILNMEGLKVYGKTGTAQSISGMPHHAWFVGYCPFAKTRIVFCVFLEYGGSSYNACTVSKNILERLKAENIL